MDVMTIECVIRDDGATVARLTFNNGDMRDLLPGESMKITVRTEGAGGSGMEHERAR